MAKTRTILIKENRKKSIELIVNPRECTVTDSVNNVRENLDLLGTVNLPGRRGLKGVSINTFLPGKYSPFGTNRISGDLKLIERWKAQHTKLRIIMTNPKVNFKALIDADSMTVKEGQNDVYISWKFTEYKDIHVPTVESIQGLIQVADPALLPREEGNAPAAGGSEVVNSKTTLWGLAVKYYQDGTQWTKIAAANGNIDPTKLREGMTLTIP